jgi:hypothetical protein
LDAFLNHHESKKKDSTIKMEQPFAIKTKVEESEASNMVLERTKTWCLNTKYELKYLTAKDL